MTPSSQRRPPDDPSYEPNKLYRAAGKPSLGGWLAITVAAYLAVSVVFVWAFTLIA